jgi:hypothetical protein
MKSFWKRAALWGLPFVALSVAIWRVQEARSWQPRVLSLAIPSFGSSGLGPMPLAWRHDGLWLLTQPTGLPYLKGGTQANPPTTWDKLRNWNGRKIPLHVATQLNDSHAALAHDASVLVRAQRDEGLAIWRDGRKSRLLREKPVPNAHNLQKPGHVDVIALSLDASRLAGSSQLYGFLTVGK